MTGTLGSIVFCNDGDEAKSARQNISIAVYPCLSGNSYLTDYLHMQRILVFLNLFVLL